MGIVRLVLSSSKNSWEGAGSNQGGKRLWGGSGTLGGGGK